MFLFVEISLSMHIESLKLTIYVCNYDKLLFISSVLIPPIQIYTYNI